MVSQQEQTRPRTKSMLSFGSSRTHKSSGSIGKMDLTESPKEKNARKLTSKTDPSRALNEAQPSVQALERPTLDSLRTIQHRDNFGNIITDPDLSNPTRPRLERPLDTIRSFEAAIDGSYKQRFSARLDAPDSSSLALPSRRSSYYQGPQRHSPQRNLGDNGGYYGNRMPPSGRPDSYAENSNYSSGHNQPARRFGPRNYSDPAMHGNNNHGVYPSQGYQQSYDTVTSGSGSGSHGTDQWGNSTEPSSENSSIDRIHQTAKQDSTDNYGFSGFGGASQFQGPILEEYHQNAPAYGQPGYGNSHKIPSSGNAYQGNSGPPQPPPHSAKQSPPRTLMRPGASSRAPEYEIRNDREDKRKSWLKRRFSRKG